MDKDIYLKNWVLLQPITATDQYLAINKFNGQACSFRKKEKPESEGWFHWLIVPAPGNRYWIFNRSAQGGAGECLALPHGTRVFGQWKFIDEPRQTFAIAHHDDGSVTLTCEEDHQVVSTRWDQPVFGWNYTPGDKQQRLRILPVEELALPVIPEIDGEPGALDRDLLRVDSFESEVVRQTPRRVVGAELVAFTSVDDGAIGERMNNSPYYLLVRETYWKQSFDEEYSGAGSNERSLEWEVGVIATSERSLEKTMNVEVGINGTYKLGGKSGPGLERGISTSFKYGTTWFCKDSVERHEKRREKSVRTFPEGKRARVVCWHLVNVYTLKRRPNEVVGQIACVEPTFRVERSFPPAGVPLAVS